MIVIIIIIIIIIRKFAKTGCLYPLHTCHACYSKYSLTRLPSCWPLTKSPGKARITVDSKFSDHQLSELPRNCCVTTAMVWDMTPLYWYLRSNPHGVTYQNNVMLLHIVLPFTRQQISDLYVCCSLHDPECGAARLCSLWRVVFWAAHIRHLSGKSQTVTSSALINLLRDAPTV